MAQRRSTLILLRHGQSVWNGADARYTGWCDVPLTVRGRVEAVGAGQLLRHRGFPASKVDAAFTSELQRAHETCELALASMAGHEQDTWSPERIRRDVRLNERHYGALQGERKNDPAIAARFGEDTLRSWRRAMNSTPPPMADDHPEWRPAPAPLTESLADCQTRALECFETAIAPALFDKADGGGGGGAAAAAAAADRTVIVVAHSNTIRALMASFDCVADADVPRLHVPNSVPILYSFERSTRALISTKLQGAAGSSHARWLLSSENHRQIRAAVQPGGMLTRAIFDAWDVDGCGALSAAEIEAGIKASFLRDGETATSCAVIAVAKEIAHDLRASRGATITLAEFERRAVASAADLQQSAVRHSDDDMLSQDWP